MAQPKTTENLIPVMLSKEEVFDAVTAEVISRFAKAGHDPKRIRIKSSEFQTEEYQGNEIFTGIKVTVGFK